MKKIAATVVMLLLSAVLVWAVSDSDDFLRANAYPISGNWNSDYYDPAKPQIISNQVHPGYVDIYGSENIASWTGFTAANDQFSQVTIVTMTGTTPQVGVILRAIPNSPGPRQYYGCITKPGDTLIYGHLNGSYFAVINGLFQLSVGDTIYCEVIGSDFLIKQNGTSVLTASDATLVGGQPGIFVSGYSDVMEAALDNWVGGDFATASIFVRHRPVMQ